MVLQTKDNFRHNAQKGSKSPLGEIAVYGRKREYSIKIESFVQYTCHFVLQYLQSQFCNV